MSAAFASTLSRYASTAWIDSLRLYTSRPLKETRSPSQRCVVAPQPVGKLQHFLIAPHPGGETREDVAPTRTRRLMPHLTVQPRGARPIDLHRHPVHAIPFHN